VALISAGVPAGVGKPGEGCRSFLRHPLLGLGVSMMGCAVLRSAESIRGRDHAGHGAGSGGHDNGDFAPTSLWAATSCGGRFLGAQRAHVMVAQGVEDEFQLPAGSGHDRDVVSTPLLDPVTELP
jgi:hypothetical protein